MRVCVWLGLMLIREGFYTARSYLAFWGGATIARSLAGAVEDKWMTSSRRISVRDVMKKEYGTIKGNATVKEALLKMQQLKTAVLVVEKRDVNDEFGLLLVSDIARKVLANDRASDRVNVYEIMNKPAVCIDPDMDIRYCSRLMARFDLMRALVVKDDAILGTVSPRALVLEGLAAIEAGN